jgi:hypothetical protein
MVKTNKQLAVGSHPEIYAAGGKLQSVFILLSGKEVTGQEKTPSSHRFSQSSHNAGQHHLDHIIDRQQAGNGRRPLHPLPH